MKEEIKLEWSFTPPDFFEKPFEHEGKDHKLEIHNGRVVATLAPGVGTGEGLFKEIHDELNSLFLGAQLVSNKPYELSNYTTVRTQPDGTAVIGVSVADGMKMGDSWDATVRNSTGKVVSDTRAERIKKKRALAILAMTHGRNPVVASLLQSHNQALCDPENALVHLFEIRDALAKEFRGKKNTRRVALGISSGDWSRLGDLANNAPLRQGRHRGQKVGQLRDATPAELNEARMIAKTMIRAYLDYLEQNP